MKNSSDSFDDLTQNVWTKYGFRGNPFDTKALSTSPQDPLFVMQALVGRERSCSESRLLTNVLRNPGGGRIAIEGEIGVGKTTFINYHRFLWEYKAKDKLFTPFREISLVPEWRVKDFLINILGALITRLSKVRPEAINANPILQEILALSKVFFTSSYQAQGSLLGIGGGWGIAEDVTLPQPSETILVYYLESLVGEIKKLGYAGVLLHFDDMELISRRFPEVIQNLLDDVRNILQISDIYYVFIGHSGFFSEIISPLERVRSIFFGYPIYLPPLTKEETLEAIELRYQILSVKGKFTRPVEDEFLTQLYDLYSGKIRFIMDAMSLIIPETSPSETLPSKQAHKLLRDLVSERVRRVLTDRELEFVRIVASQDTFTNREVVSSLGISASHVSQCLARLQELNFVYLHQHIGRERFYKVSEDVKIIKEVKKTTSGLLRKTSQSPQNLPQSAFSRKVKGRLILAEELLQTRGELTCKEYHERVGVSLPTAKRDLARLVAMGKAKALGQGRGVYYVPVKKARKSSSQNLGFK